MSGRRSKAAGARYDKWYAAGYRSYHPAGEALEIFQEIKDRTGMTDREIADAAGFASTRTLMKLKTGEHDRVQGETYRRLATLRNSNPAPVRVPAIGAQRRLDGLSRMGWPLRDIRVRLGFLGDYVRNLEPTHLIPIATHQKLVALYDELSMIPGPSERTRKLAERSGKPPPLAWDDDNIDDPKAKPNLTGGHRQVPGYIDHAKVVRRLRGDKSIHLNKYEAAEAVRILRSRGVRTYDLEHTHGLKLERYK